MGSPDAEQDRSSDEGPIFPAKIERPFWLGKYEVTQAQWKALMGTNPSQFVGDDNPVESVTWDGFQEFLTKLNSSVGGGTFRLPTEVEWEYACRAGTNTRFSFGDDPGYRAIEEFAWQGANSGGVTHPVGQKTPNPWGLYDMHGNVWEWCWSLYGPYPYNAADGREDPKSREARVFRGGCAQFRAKFSRSAFRYKSRPELRGSFHGIRVARNAE